MKSLPASQAGLSRIALRSAAALILVLAGCTPVAPSTTHSPAATIRATPAASSPGASPIDTTNWTVYGSKRYGFTIKHPPGWTVNPAEHDWTLEADAPDWGGGGSEGFSAPFSLYVTVWSTPAKDVPATLEGVTAWVRKYCDHGGSSCIDLDRAVPLCNGTDCQSGLLVGFNGVEFEAFFIGGKHKDTMVGVSVGLPEGHENAAKYGGARRLLEGFLAGMGVCPAQPDQTQKGCP